ncbi:hypothetical protein ACFWGD_07240 [Corynebacterium sp. NPDC060344]|uniref:hypothetical protein n=1 Tax=Corynebacterium sp. NPDC060344 TaxID=3347101 RepID=UPI0036647A8A
MGRLLILILIIVVIVLVWRAFGPGTWGKGAGRSGMAAPGALGTGRMNRGPRADLGQPRIKGPDDDEDFLWRLEKQRFDERRARERAAEAERERARLDEERRRRAGGSEGNSKGTDMGNGESTGRNDEGHGETNPGGNNPGGPDGPDGTNPGNR